MAEPATGLIINTVKTGTGAAWKLWIAYGNQKEVRRLLENSLERAICPDKHGDPQVQVLARDLEAAMHKTGSPQPRTGNPFTRAGRFARRLLPGKGFRQRPPAHVFGPSFGEHLSSWLRSSAEPAGFDSRLAAIACVPQPPTVSALAERFPPAFDVELFDDPEPSSFREQLASELLLSEAARRERTERLGAARRALAAASSAAVPGSLAFAAADGLGVDEMTAALIGFGAAAVGAAASGVVGWSKSAQPATERGRAQGMALVWVAELLSNLSGQRCPPDAKALQTALYEVLMRPTDRTRTNWRRLSEEPAELIELEKAAAQAGDGALLQALVELRESLQTDDSVDSQRLKMVRLGRILSACEP